MLKKILIPLVVGILLAAGGWTVKSESRISVVESRVDGIHDTLEKMDKKLDQVLEEQRTVRQELRQWRSR
jgi:prefoldin subunit 5